MASGCGGKGFADGGERVRIGGGVRARDAPDVLLVDGDDLVDMLPARDRVVLARHLGGAVQALAGSEVEDIENQRGLARTGDARHRHQQPKRDIHRQVFQVELASRRGSSAFVISLTALFRDRHAGMSRR